MRCAVEVGGVAPGAHVLEARPNATDCGGEARIFQGRNILKMRLCLVDTFCFLAENELSEFETLISFAILMN